MAVPRVAPTIGATTGTHHQPLPALEWEDKRTNRRCQRCFSQTHLPYELGIVRQVPQ